MAEVPKMFRRNEQTGWAPKGGRVESYTIQDGGFAHTDAGLVKLPKKIVEASGVAGLERGDTLNIKAAKWDSKNNRWEATDVEVHLSVGN